MQEPRSTRTAVGRPERFESPCGRAVQQNLPNAVKRGRSRQGLVARTVRESVGDASYNDHAPRLSPDPGSPVTDPLFPPPEDRRREVFAALVEAQDRGLSVHQSKQDVAAMFGVTWHTVEQIEREGMDKDWPPL
jgi:hypothetical protein